MPLESNEIKLNKAFDLVGKNNLQEAKKLCEQIVGENPNDFNAHTLLGIILVNMGDSFSALAPLERAVEIDRSSASAISNYGNALLGAGKLEQAVEQQRRAIELNPDFPDAYFNLGMALGVSQNYVAAIESFTKAIQLRSSWAEAYAMRGTAFREMGHLDEALRDYNEAIVIDPSGSNAYLLRAILRHPSQTPERALEDFATSLKIKPDSCDALLHLSEFQRGTIGNFPAAELSAERLYRLNPDYPYALGNLIHFKMLNCNWSGLGELDLELKKKLKMNRPTFRPFGFMGYSDSEADLQKVARIHSADFAPRQSTLRKEIKLKTRRRIQLGYLAGEFQAHPTSFLMTRVFELHNQDDFNIIAFDSGGWEDKSEWRKRQKKAFNEMIDISQMGDEPAAQLIAEKEIDILIDLNGFFGRARQRILAYKPAPLQVSYLGCPGTMGTSYMDYLIADKIVIPEVSTQFYDEKIVRLPNSYQANDNLRRASHTFYSRDDLGLPREGFVFCCFNNSYKITPATFSYWMRILQNVEGSVLWLLGYTAAPVLHLRNEAQRFGVNGERLIFAKWLSYQEHLARHRQADLFLDTLPYNAHTTASDALWMGVPVLTLVGNTFPGRVGASLLTALDVPELITHTPEEFVDTAVKFATQPDRLNFIKNKIKVNRKTKPLFNSKLFTQHFEQALKIMHNRQMAGLEPSAIQIQHNG